MQIKITMRHNFRAIRLATFSILITLTVARVENQKQTFILSLWEGKIGIITIENNFAVLSKVNMYIMSIHQMYFFF